ncbi:MAG: hypothetical protein WCR97_01640 [Bacilli bacterium]
MSYNYDDVGLYEVADSNDGEIMCIANFNNNAFAGQFAPATPFIKVNKDDYDNSEDNANFEF